MVATFLAGVQNVLLRNGTAGRRLNAVEEARGTIGFLGVGVLFRTRNGLAGCAKLKLLKCLLGVLTMDGVRVFCEVDIIKSNLSGSTSLAIGTLTLISEMIALTCGVRRMDFALCAKFKVDKVSLASSRSGLMHARSVR